VESLSHHVEALLLDPASESAAAHVRKGARAQGQLKMYVDAFTERGRMLAERGSAESASVAYLEAAMVAEEIQDWPMAAELFRLGYLADPGKRDALVLLGRALAQAGQPRELVPILREMLRGSTDPAAKAELHLQLADFLATELRDTGAAMEEIRAALMVDRQNTATIARAKEILTAHGLGESFSHTIGDWGAKMAPPIAPIELSEVGPRPPPSRPSLAPSLVPSAPSVGSSPSVPTQGTGSSGSISRQAALFRASLNSPALPARESAPPPPAAPPSPEDNANQAIIAQLAAQLAASPSDVGIIDELMRLGQLVEDPTAVTQAYESAARANTDASLRSYIRTRLGTLYVRALEQPEEAIRVFAAILDDDPRNPEARRMLVAREGPDTASEGVTPEQERQLIATLERERTAASSAIVTNPGTQERLIPKPAAPAVVPPPSVPTLKPMPSSLTPRASMVSLPYAVPSIAPQPFRVSSTQLGLVLGVVVLGLLGAFLSYTDVLWPQFELNSKPPGATIIVDGEMRTEKTPATLRLAPGVPHAIELQHKGAAPRTVGKALTLGYLNSMTASPTFEPLPRKAMVTPVKAKVELNGQLVGTATSVMLRNFSLENPVVLRVTADGYMPVQRNFEKGFDVPESQTIVLTPLPKP